MGRQGLILALLRFVRPTVGVIIFFTSYCFAGIGYEEVLDSIHPFPVELDELSVSASQPKLKKTFLIDAENGSKTIIRQYAGNDYIAYYFPDKSQKKTHSIRLNPITNDLLLIIDKKEYHLILSYSEYNAINTYFNLARLLSKAFRDIKNDILYCETKEKNQCPTGWLEKTETAYTYQPYYTKTLQNYHEMELGNGLTQIDFDEDSVLLTKHGKGILSRAGDKTRQLAQDSNDKKKYNNANDSKNDSRRQSRQAPSKNRKGNKGSSLNSGNSNDDGGDDNQERRDDHKYDTNSPEDEETLKNYHNSNVLTFINQALRFAISGTIDIDTAIIGAMNQFLNLPLSGSINRLSAFLLERLYHEYGISESGIVLAMRRVNRNLELQLEYEPGDQPNNFLSALINVHTDSADRSFQPYARQILSIYYNAILDTPLLESTLDHLQEYGFSPQAVFNLQQHQSVLPAILNERAAGVDGLSPLTLLNFINRFFDSKTGSLLLMTMISGFVYDHYSNLLNPDVYFHRFDLYATAIICLFAQTIPSLLNTLNLYGILRQDDDLPPQLVFFLISFNTLKDIFSALSTGSGLIENPMYTRLFQGLHVLFSSLFSYFLLKTIISTSESENEEHESTSPKDSQLLQYTLIPLTISTFSTLSFYFISNFLDFNIPSESNNYILFTLSSLARNLFSNQNSPQEEVIRVLAFFSLSLTITALWNQHRYFRNICSDSTQFRDKLNILWNNLWVFYLNAALSSYTFIMSFADRAGNNPMVFYINLILSFIKSRVFENRVDVLRREALTKPIIDKKSIRINRDFNNSVKHGDGSKNVSTSGSTTVAESIQSFFNQFDQVNIRNQYYIIMTLKENLPPRLYHLMRQIGNRPSTQTITRSCVSDFQNAESSRPAATADIFAQGTTEIPEAPQDIPLRTTSRFQVMPVTENDEEVNTDKTTNAETVIDIPDDAGNESDTSLNNRNVPEKHESNG